ncbi:MAG: RtcB family protein [bacterium]
MKRTDRYTTIIPRTGIMKTDAVIFASDAIRVEDGAVNQLVNTASIEEGSIVMATPDIHVGFGVPIGCIWASQKYVSPCAVGYDINCGMRLLATPFKNKDIDIKNLAHSIRRDVPLGEGKKNIKLSRDNFIKVLNQGVKGFLSINKGQDRIYEYSSREERERDIENIEENGSLKGEHDKVSSHAFERGRNQLATLGGGNHFIEIQEVNEIFSPALGDSFNIHKGQIVVMIHSGSRGLGHQVGGDYMHASLIYDLENNLLLPAKDLSYFPIDSQQGSAYLGAMRACANFAYVNRQAMAMLVRRCIRHDYGRDIELPTVYDVSHNIASFEGHQGKQYLVHRKGATRAFGKTRMKGTAFEGTGQPVLIPGSMGTASYLLAGVESGARSLFSVNHGAGRVMSRRQAGGKITRKGKIRNEGAISDKRFHESMKGIHLICENYKHIKEEAPDAYKNIDQIIETVCGAGLALKVARMAPLAVLKG